MNEKIKELYKQAHDNIQDCDGHLYYDENFNPEKFAELMVKECEKCGESLKNHYLDENVTSLKLYI